jgi:hypothetical protein
MLLSLTEITRRIGGRAARKKVQDKELGYQHNYNSDHHHPDAHLW